MANFHLPTTQIIQKRNRHLGPNCQIFFADDPLHIVKGRAQFLFDDEGKAYLDCVNNVCHVGHCHKRVAEAISKQVHQLNTNNRYLHSHLAHLIEKITATLPNPLNVVYLCNSGSEANDLAFRIARTVTGKKDIIVVDHAYHGNTTVPMDASPYKFNQPTGGGKPNYVHITSLPDVYRGKYSNKSHSGADFGKLYSDEVRDIISNLQKDNRGLSCFIAESIICCGGQIFLPPNYLSRIYEYVRKAGGLCIADEVQVGYGRVGSHWWAFEMQNVIPDIVTLGKPMGNGHPVSAIVTTKEIAEKFNRNSVEYFNTFGGNPVSCAAALAVFDVIDDDKLMENATKVGKLALELFNSLKEHHSIIGDVRGVGLFFGVEFVKDRETLSPATEEAAFIKNELRKRLIIGQIDGPFNNVLKFKPPMCFSCYDVQRVAYEVDKILHDLEESKGVTKLCLSAPLENLTVSQQLNLWPGLSDDEREAPTISKEAAAEKGSDLKNVIFMADVLKMAALPAILAVSIGMFATMRKSLSW